MADGDASIFGHLADNFDELLTAFLAQLREKYANDLPLDRRVESKVAFLNGLFDWMQRVGIPRLNSQSTRLRGGNAGEFANAHLRTIDFHQNVLDQRG